MIYYINKQKVVLYSLMFALAVSFTACKKYENPEQIFEEYGGSMEAAAVRKVLIINVDGAVGADVKTINPTNIAEMLKTSKYSFNELRDAVSSDAGSLASMLTGVSSAKHRIADDSYMPINSGDDDHAAIVNYPSMFSRMLDVRPEFKTVTITTDAALNKYLIHADHRILISTDAQVKDSAVNILQNNNAKVVVADFRGVKQAGIDAGFSPSATIYKAAIEKVDGYIGEMLAALKKRKEYANEDWLVIVTTNRGGDENTPKPGFIICYNPKLKSQGISKEGFNTMRFKGTGVNGYIKDDKGLYDPGANKDFSVQLQIKFNVNTYYAGFLSKSTGLTGQVSTGWSLFQSDGDKYNAVFGGSAYGGSGKVQVSGGVVSDGKWHTITMTVKTVGATRIASTYTDGVLNATGNIQGTNNLSVPTQPFQIGWKSIDNSGTGLDFYAADLLYFNTALDAAVIQSNIALKDISKHPNYANLIGYWPIDDGGGAVVSNNATTGYSFLMRGSGSWDALGNDIPASRSPQSLTDGTLSIVATGPDVTALTFYWLKMPVKSDWSLDGVPWISNFEIEFIK